MESRNFFAFNLSFFLSEFRSLWVTCMIFDKLSALGNIPNLTRYFSSWLGTPLYDKVGTPRNTASDVMVPPEPTNTSHNERISPLSTTLSKTIIRFPNFLFRELAIKFL